MNLVFMEPWDCYYEVCLYMKPAIIISKQDVYFFWGSFWEMHAQCMTSGNEMN